MSILFMIIVSQILIHNRLNNGFDYGLFVLFILLFLIVERWCLHILNLISTNGFLNYLVQTILWFLIDFFFEFLFTLIELLSWVIKWLLSVDIAEQFTWRTYFRWWTTVRHLFASFILFILWYFVFKFKISKFNQAIIALWTSSLDFLNFFTSIYFFRRSLWT